MLSDYRADEIGKAVRLDEPKRSCKLDAIERNVLSQLRADFSRYRSLAQRLRLRRCAESLPDNPVICDDLDVSLSLAFTHVYNGYAHFVTLEEMGAANRPFSEPVKQNTRALPHSRKACIIGGMEFTFMRISDPPSCLSAVESRLQIKVLDTKNDA
ncbi:hypothetical protein [uncultured Roseibium sp.]|uniref:hypothetical protein n=1 Tax=uncultured Roseibium sp. TaxID=1936171 RepID=UPI00260527AF|nr:hypothetical protein [uncultured Roseibium sp.]